MQNLFMGRKADLGLTYLFISHSLGVVQHLSDRVVILYLGRIVEVAPTERRFAAPNHPYTKALLEVEARIDARRRDFEPIKGEIPSPSLPAATSTPAAPSATERCKREAPALKKPRP